MIYHLNHTNRIRLGIFMLIISLSATVKGKQITLNGVTYALDNTTMTATAITCDDDLEVLALKEYVTTEGNEELYTVTTIAEKAFVNKSFTEVAFPATIETIGGGAIAQCSKLRHLTIPASTTTIGESNFTNCPSLDEIEVDEENPNYCDVDGVFFDKAMTNLIAFPASRGGVYTVPDGVTRISAQCFSSSKLTEVVVSKDVDLIYPCVFQRMYNLTDITVVSDNPKYHSEDGVLFHNKELSALLTYPGGKKDNNASYVIPAQTKILGYWSFAYTMLKRVDIHANIMSINKESFIDCTELKSLVVKQKTPLILTPNMFKNLPKDATLYVPTGCVEAYKAAAEWSTFRTIIEGEPDPTAIETTEAPSTPYIYDDSKGLVLRNAPSNHLVEVYNIRGSMLYQAMTDDNGSASLPVEQGAYIVRVGDVSMQALR